VRKKKTSWISWAANIKHVIFIIKENRTYDQVLGDLPQGNGDPDLAEFGASLTPNFHNLASQFVTLDTFTIAAK
jgi:phospholipase C